MHEAMSPDVPDADHHAPDDPGQRCSPADAADLAAIGELLRAPQQLDGVTRSLTRPHRRVLVSRDDRAAVQGVVVVEGTPDVDGLGEIILLAGDGQDRLRAAAATSVGDMGCSGLRDERGEVVAVPDPGPDLTARFLRAAAIAANSAEVAAGSAAGHGPTARKADGSVSAVADEAADASSAAILGTLGIPMLSEERDDIGLADPSAPWLVVDPIDGTGNYLAGLPPWAFAAGLVADGRPLAGYVMDLSSGRRWWGAVGRGAFRDGRPITPRAGATLIVPTPPAGGSAIVPEGYRRIRITGCTAVDLCLVAAGSAGAWHDLDREGTHVHDVAASLGVLAAAGGVALDPEGEDLRLTPDTAGLIRFAAAADRDSAASLVAAFREPSDRPRPPAGRRVTGRGRG